MSKEQTKKEFKEPAQPKKLDQETVNNIANGLILPIREALFNYFFIAEGLPIFDSIKISEVKQLRDDIANKLSYNQAASILYMAHGASMSKLKQKDAESQVMINVLDGIESIIKAYQDYIDEVSNINHKEDVSKEFLKQCGLD